VRTTDPTPNTKANTAATLVRAGFVTTRCSTCTLRPRSPTSASSAPPRWVASSPEIGVAPERARTAASLWRASPDRLHHKKTMVVGEPQPQQHSCRYGCRVAARRSSRLSSDTTNSPHPHGPRAAPGPAGRSWVQRWVTHLWRVRSRRRSTRFGVTTGGGTGLAVGARVGTVHAGDRRRPSRSSSSPPRTSRVCWSTPPSPSRRCSAPATAASGAVAAARRPKTCRPWREERSLRAAQAAVVHRARRSSHHASTKPTSTTSNVACRTLAVVATAACALRPASAKSLPAAPADRSGRAQHIDRRRARHGEGAEHGVTLRVRPSWSATGPGDVTV